MSPRSEEQFEAIRQQRKKEIMDSALELFADKGYHNTSISSIAKKAGVSKGLMYNYFESKEELLISILDSGFEELLAFFDPNNDGVLDSGELKYFIEKTFDSLKNNIEFWRFYFRISFQQEVLPIVKNKMEALMKSTMKMQIEYFRNKGFEDPLSEAILFGALLDGISMDYVFGPEYFPIEKLKEAIIKKYC